MRLTYNVLWIDDQPAHVRSFRERIDRHLDEQGFSLDVNIVSSLQDVDAAVGGHVHNDGVDLILVDYDLGPGHGGESALVAVRDRFKYKDILFYSAEDPGKLREIAYGAKLDGVYFSTRISLADDAISVIDKTLHKVMDIDHMRGVVMAATSDIDLFIERSVLAVFEKLDAEKKSEFKAGLVETLRAKLADWAKGLEKASGKDGVSAIFKQKHLCTAADRLALLLAELEKFSTDGRTLLETAREYRDRLVPRRNQLAHLVVKVVDGERVLQGATENMGVDDMCELRRDLLRHRANFQEIAVIVDVDFE